MRKKYRIALFIMTFALGLLIPLSAKAEPTVERTITLKIGETKGIGLSDGLGGPLQGVVWASLDPSIASIDQNGTVRANSPGTTVVYATNLESQRGVKVIVEGDPEPTTAPAANDPATGTDQNTGAVTAQTPSTDTGANTATNPLSTTQTAAAKKTKIALNKKKITLEVKSKFKLKLTGASGKIKWSSQKKKIATVSKKGVVKVLKAGKTVITAKYKGKKYKCKVTVIKKKSTRKNTNKSTNTTTTTTTSTTTNNGPVQFKESPVVITDKKEPVQLTLLNADPSKITWSLKYPEDDRKMSVTDKGVVTVKINGTFGVVAEYEGKKYECMIYCFNLSANSIEGLVYYSNLDQRWNESQGLSVSISGIEMSDWSKITWSNSNSGVVSMEIGKENGHVNIVPCGGGTAVISATFMGKTATCTVNVKENNSKL